MPIRNRTKSTHARKELKVLNRLGLHARPAVEFVRHVQSFRSEMTIIKANGERFRAGGVIDVLLADLDCGATFILEAEGPDAAEAVERLEKLLRELETFDELPEAGSGSPRERLD